MHETADHVLALLRSLDFDLDVRLDLQDSFCAIHLPQARDADYRFIIHVYEDGEPQIGAVLVDGYPEAYFWYWPFEEPDFDSPDRRRSEFLSAVRRLLTSRSRIRQKRGWLTTEFRCEVKSGEGWSRAGPSLSGLKWGCKPPPTEQKVTFYESPSLVSL